MVPWIVFGRGAFWRLVGVVPVVAWSSGAPAG